MRRETNSKTTVAIAKEQMVDSSKLMSLLALAAGAVAMPETGNAAIVYNDLGATPGIVGGGNPSFLITLPGTARLGFQTAHAVTTLGTVRGVLAGQVAGYVRLKTNLSFAVHVAVTNPATHMVSWNQLNYNAANKGTLGRATSTQHIPNSYDHDYLPFEFKDSTQGNLMLYGWVDISLSNDDLNVQPGGPLVTIWRYAYDDKGNQIFMGQTVVPEPTSMSLMALGAMALGARGVRAWRKRKDF
jgi:hypothetical protein